MIAYRKAWRDVRHNPGRALLISTALGVGVLALTALGSGTTVLQREMDRSFTGTVPASATLQLDTEPRDVPALLRDVQTLPETRADLRRVTRAWAQRPPSRTGPAGARVPLQLFVVRDFADLRVATFSFEEGRPPMLGEIALEQSALSFLRAGLGSDLPVAYGHGDSATLPVVGVVHDPGQAPAWMEGTGYGYVTAPTLELLGGPGSLDELIVRFEEDGLLLLDREEISRRAEALEPLARRHGAEVAGVSIPPPGEHPHQGQMEALLLTLLVFAGFALLLAGILASSSLGAFLHTQRAQIATLKTLGAQRGRVLRIYTAVVALLCAAGAALGLPSGLLLGRLYTQIASGILNLRVASFWPSGGALALLVATALGLPLLLALPAVLRTTRASVQEGLHDLRGARDEKSFAASMWGRLRPLETRPFAAFAVRNAFRRPQRMALSLLTIAAANALFLASANVGSAWLELLDRAAAAQPHDAQVAFGPATGGRAAAQEALAPVRGGAQVATEVWSRTFASSPERPGERFPVIALPATSPMLSLELESGRWLSISSPGQIVLNHGMAHKLGAAPGDHVELVAGEHPVSWEVIGVATEIGSLGVGYVTELPGAWETDTHIAVLASARTGPDARGQSTLAAQAQEALRDAGLSPGRARLSATRNKGLLDHVVIFQRTLTLMALLLGAVGALGLASALGLSVLERTREIGVLRTLGANRRAVGRIVLLEALALACVAWALAAALSIVLSAWVGRATGLAFVLAPLPLSLAAWAYAASLGLTLALAALASLGPARAVQRLPVTRALAST